MLRVASLTVTFKAPFRLFKPSLIQPRGEPTVSINASLDGTEGLAFPSDNHGSRSALKPGRVASGHEERVAATQLRSATRVTTTMPACVAATIVAR